jgi:hypothetical protein
MPTFTGSKKTPAKVLHPVIATLRAKSPLTSWQSQLEKQPPGQLVTMRRTTPGTKLILRSRTVSAPQAGEMTNWHNTPKRIGHLLLTRFQNSFVSTEAAKETF